MPIEFELQVPTSYLHYRLWKTKDNSEICDCDLKCGTCRAKINWTIDRLGQMWKTSFFDFDFVIERVMDQDVTFINFNRIDRISRDDFEECFLKKWFF